MRYQSMSVFKLCKGSRQLDVLKLDAREVAAMLCDPVLREWADFHL